MYIFILNLTPGFNGLGKDNYKMRREAFKFWYLVSYIRDFTVTSVHILCSFQDADNQKLYAELLELASDIPNQTHPSSVSENLSMIL